MKFNLKTLVYGVVAMVSAGFVSCSDDDFTATIFDTDPSIDYLDKNSYTFPLDTFVKAEFLEPYNMKYIYRMEDKGSDMTKNLTPADYDKSVDLAVLSKHLWYDIYKDLAGANFLKQNSPRIIHVVGSKNYNPTQGTETLGDASGGIKINLYNANQLDPNNIDLMNEYFFKTMHHEFTHILDQTVYHPTAFNAISTGRYDASGWSDASDSVKAGIGFITPYASSAVDEDWAESLANYVTADTLTMQRILGAAEYEWEEVDCDNYAAYNRLLKPGCDIDTIGYFKSSNNGENKIYRRACLRDVNDYVVLGEDGKPQWLHNSGVNGREVIIRKINYVREYMKTNFNINLDELRRRVQTAEFVTDADGNFVYDANGNLINRLTYTGDRETSVMDELRQLVYKFKELQNQ